MANATEMSPFPFLNTPAFWWVVLAASCMFGVAIVIVLLRRHAETQRRIRIEWSRMEGLLDERGLTGADRARFLDMLTRCRVEDPLTSATRRHAFDLCVDEYMRRLSGHAAADEILRAGAELHEARIALGLDYVPFGQRIESTRELHIGQDLWLALAGDTAPRWCRAQVSLVDEARFVAVGTSDEANASWEYRQGSRLHCRLWREDDARYLFDIEIHHVDTAPLRWTFLHTRELQRIQDRAHYRVRIDLATDIDALNAPLNDVYEGLEKLPAVTTFRGRVTNLSAGGVAIVSHQAVPNQVLLRFPLVLPEVGRLLVTAKPVETAPQSAGRYLIRAYFVGLDEESQDGIARFVLHRQQRLVAPQSGEKVTLL